MKTSRARLLRIASAAAIAVTTFSIAACENDPSGPADDEIVIGGLFSLTGNWASLGVASKAAMEIGIEDVNKYLADGGTGMQFSESKT
jgi:branched-chain amino acid transport system substrate-binding protein